MLPHPRLVAVAIVACVATHVLAAPLSAAAPKLQYLFPAGVQRGAKVVVECHGEFDWPVRVWASGARVKVLDTKGKLEVFVPKNCPTDRVWLRLFNEDGASPIVPLMLGNLPETTEQEPNDSTQAPQNMASVAAPPRDSELVVNGRLQKNGDVDTFAVQLTSGQTLVAAVEANASFGSPMDGILQVVTPNGHVLAENHDDQGLDPRLAFTAPVDGLYCVRLFAFPATPNQRIQFHGADDYVYRLTLTTGPYITHTQPNVQQSDGERLVPSTVELRGWNLPQGVRVPVERISGDASTPDEGSGRTPLGVVTAPNWSGAARVHLTTSPVLARPTAERTSLPIPSALTRTIECPGQVDEYVLVLRDKQSIQIDVVALEQGSFMVPTVRFVKPDKTVAVETSERGAAKDANLRFTAAADGEYLLTIEDRFGHGSDRHFYRLEITEPHADYQLTLPTDAITVEGGGETKVKVGVRRTNVGDHRIDAVSVQFRGLPPGVSVEPVVSPAKGELSKQVTLQLKAAADCAAFSGPVQIVGSSEEYGERLALTPKKWGMPFGHLWLTVKAKKENATDEGATKPDGEVN